MEALKVILGCAVPALALTLPGSQPQNCQWTEKEEWGSKGCLVL